MAENELVVPGIFFIVITLLTVGLFYFAARKSRAALGVLGLWMSIQGGVGLSGFYQTTHTLPPRFMLLILPPAAFIVALFVFPAGQKFMDGIDVGKLTVLHTIRIGVEIILYFLFLAGAIPEIMTFEGRNLDIVAGLTAPLIYYFGFVKTVLPTSSLRLWNLVCLGLLINIVVLATLSIPTSFQQFGFDQPNVAITYFPFMWLPSVVVPLVLFSHVVAIRHSYRKNQVPS